MPPETTPMMQQYLRMKELHPDCILFFRLGDFYEMFNEDAKLVSKELELTLTSRDRGKPEAQRTPMCGVPYHSADAYIARLIAKGYKVAICEQMEDPALAKGLVDRDIIRIITPGTVMTSSMLEEGRNNFICAVYRDSAGTGLCFCDISTGECSVTSFTGPEADEHLYNELGRFTPREAMLSDGAYSDGALVDFLVKRLDCRCENGGEARFRLDAARTAAEKQFSAGLDALPAGDDAALQAVGGLLSYLYETQKTDLSHLSTLTYFTTGQFMELDLTARRNLELTETLRSKEKKGSLLWVLDKTRTAMGHRLIRAWMERPLLSPAAIGRRLGAVGELVGDAIGREELTLTLREITDLERLIGRIVYGTAGGRDLVALANGLGRLPALRERLAGCSSALLASLREELDDLTELRELIGRAIVDEPPFSVREGGFIRAGYHPEVDRLRDIMANGKGLVASIEAREKEKTGIKSLKDAKGKVVNIGNPGSGNRQNAIDVFEAAGINIEKDLKAESIKAADAPRMLQDGRIDGFFYTVGHPNGNIKEATAGKRKTRIVSITDIEPLVKKFPYYSLTNIDMAQYPEAANANEKVTTVGMLATFVTSAKVPDDVVYAITKEVFENLDEFKKLHPALEGLTRETMLEGLTAPIHPGALKYYKEAGLMK